MKNKANLTAALFFLCSGCATTRTALNNVSAPELVKVLPQLPAEQEVEFKSIVSGRAATSDGTPFSFQSYKTSDGIAISTRVERHSSPAAARKELLRTLRTSVDILEQGSRFDSEGRKIGERAVVTYREEPSDQPKIVIIWTENEETYFIESLSLPHALQFEKWYLNIPN